MRRSWQLSALAILLAIPLVAWTAGEMPLRVTKGPEEFAPALSEGFLAWSQVPNPESFREVVYAQVLGGSTFRVNSRGSFARMGGLDGSRLVFAQYRGLDDEGELHGGDLRVVDLATRSPVPLPDGVNTKKEEFGPSMSGDWLLFGRADTGRHPRIRFLLQNLTTGETRQLRSSRSPFGSPGQVNGLFATWGSCARRHGCDVFRHDITSGETLELPNPNEALQFTPGVAADGTVYFFRSGFGCGTNVYLQRWSPSTGTVTMVDFPDGVDGTSAYVYDDPDTGRQVAYARHRCLKDKQAPAPSDLYQIID